MVAEVFVALSLAGNIVQFVDLGTRIFSKTRELKNSTEGALKGNISLETIATSLKRLGEALTIPFSPDDPSSAGHLSNDEKDMVNLARECQKVADELLQALGRIKWQGSHRILKSFRQALLTVWTKSEIDEIIARFGNFQAQLTISLHKILTYVLATVAL